MWTSRAATKSTWEMSATRHRRVRVYQSLRSAHLERAHQLVAASIIYGARRYDFDDSLAGGLDLIQARGARMVGVLMRSRIDELEINEPLQRPGLGRTAAAVATVRIGAVLCRRPVTILTYAIENRDPFGGAGRLSLKHKARLRVDCFLSRYVSRHVDRIAYGTDSSRDLYESALRVELRHAEAVTIAALPAPCNCELGKSRTNDAVLFLGALEPRKGFPELLAAWSRVVELRPSAKLFIIGKGSLELTARKMAADNSSISLVVDPPRAHIHRALRESALVILLSQPAPNWREQVGLPIVEGLAHGCSIVTTQETGLADWLRAHDHTVLAPNVSVGTLANSVVDALKGRRPSESILADLPNVDGRLRADEWLFAGKGDADDQA